MKKQKSTLEIIKSKISTAHYIELCETLEVIGEEKVELLTEIKYKNSFVSLILSIFFGVLGVDRFYQGKIGGGIFKLLINLLTGGAAFCILSPLVSPYLYLLGSYLYIFWGACIFVAFITLIWYLLDVLIAPQTIKDENYYKVLDKLEETVNFNDYPQLQDNK